MCAARTFAEVFSRFMHNPKLTGTFAESIYKGYSIVENDELIRSNSQLLLSLKVSPELININGTIHGGALMTILDTSTTLAILKADRKLRKTVSVEMNFTFASPGKLDEILYILADCEKVGKSIAFSSAQIFGEDKKRLVGAGRHLKAILDQPFDN